MAHIASTVYDRGALSNAKARAFLLICAGERERFRVVEGARNGK